MTFAALVFALVLSGSIIALVGGDPIRSYGHIVDAAFGSVGVISRHAGQGDAADPDRPRLRARVPDAALEHRRRGPVPARAPGARARSSSRRSCRPGRPAIVVIPAMMLAGAVAGGAVGPHPGHPPGAPRGQRDHHDPDAQLRRPVRGSSSGSSGRGARAASSRREPFPRRGVAAPPDRLRRGVPGARPA